jgi:hypothetical protein
MTFFTTACIVSIEDVQICDIVSIDNPEVNIQIEQLHCFQMKQSAFFSHTEIYFNVVSSSPRNERDWNSFV